MEMGADGRAPSPPADVVTSRKSSTGDANGVMSRAELDVLAGSGPARMPRESPTPLSEHSGWSQSSSDPTARRRKVKPTVGLGAPPVRASCIRFLEKVREGPSVDIHHGIYHASERTHIEVAVKLLKECSSGGDVREWEQHYSELVMESDLLSKIEHPHIVRFVGFTGDRNHPLVLLEWLEGENVYKYLHQRGRRFRTLDSVLQIALPVAQAMQYLHDRNIIHRDLKSSNLMLDNKGRVTLIDFGLARFEAANGAMTPRTGSYRWAAPEVLRGDPYYRSADIFSFGIMLHEIITGDLPYAHIKPASNAGNCVAFNALRPPLLQPTPNTTDELRDLVHRCWSEDPKKRPTFRDIVEVLESIQPSVPQTRTRSAGGAALGPSGSRRLIDEEGSIMPAGLFSISEMFTYLKGAIQRNCTIS